MSERVDHSRSDEHRDICPNVYSYGRRSAGEPIVRRNHGEDGEKQEQTVFDDSPTADLALAARPKASTVEFRPTAQDVQGHSTHEASKQYGTHSGGRASSNANE